MKNIIKKILNEEVYNIFEGNQSEEEILAEDGIKDEDCVLSFQKGNEKLEWPLFSLPAAYTCPFATRCKNFPARWDPNAPNEKGGTGAFRRFASTGKTLSTTKKTEFLCYAARAQAQYPASNMNAFRNLDLINRAYRDKGINGITDLILNSMDYYEKEKRFKFDIMRIHEAGDFFTSDYMKAWFEVARQRPRTLFYAYTTSIPFWIENMNLRPDNFKLIASMDDENVDLINQYGLRYSRVVGSEEEAEELGLPVDVDDRIAWDTDMNFALMIHGPQHKGSEMAKALKANREAGVYEKMKAEKGEQQTYKDYRRELLRRRLNQPEYIQGELEFPELEESYYGLNSSSNLINENEDLDWVNDIPELPLDVEGIWHLSTTSIKDVPFRHGVFNQNPLDTIPAFDHGDYWSIDAGGWTSRKSEMLRNFYMKDPEDDSFVLIPKNEVTKVWFVPYEHDDTFRPKIIGVRKDINENENLDWVKEIDPIGFVIKTFKESDTLQHGKLVNGSYAVSVDITAELIPFWVESTYQDEKVISKELTRRIGVSCHFDLGRGGDDELLMSISVNSKKNLEKVLNWLDSSDEKIKESLIRENEEFGSEDILLQGHKGYPGKVFVHRNLNKPPYWTIKARHGEDAGIVIGYDKTVHLKNVTFVVGEKSRQRVLASGQKNVHAGVVGNIVEGGTTSTRGWIPVTYNPYQNSTFVRVDNGEPVFRAKEAILKNAKEVWIKL